MPREHSRLEFAVGCNVPPLNAAAALVAALFVLAGSAPAAVAQTSDVLPVNGSTAFGFRLYDVTGDAARHQRYQDLRSGPEVDQLKFARETERWIVRANAQNIGYRDQRYFASYERPGRVRASFTWDEIPLFNGSTTRTPLVETAPGEFRLDDEIQGGIQAGRLTLADAAAIARQIDVRSIRRIAALALTVTPMQHVDLKLNVTSTERKGAQPWGVGFGFSNVVEVAAPLNHRTTDVATNAEWANGRAMLRMGYDGSWFQNSVESLVVDNPVRLTDAVGQASQARMALWPSSTAHSVNAAGSLKLPGRSRATGYVSFGNWRQDAALIPFTINTALPVLPLDRPTADATADITAMNYTFTSSPAPLLWFSARFKRYDFDNRTPTFNLPSYVRTDQAVTTSALGKTEPLGYVRDNFDADASFTPFRFTALKVGYGREEVSRAHRFFERTKEDFIRGSLDFTGRDWITLRGIMERSTRTGTGLDEEVLDQVGEQVTLRQFDISDRHRDRMSGILQLTPFSSLGITGSAAVGNDLRPNAEFGLVRNIHRVYSVSVDAAPDEGTLFGFTYGYERYRSGQNSRQASAGAQFLDPSRNWTTHGFERVHTANASADLLRWIPRTELRFAYDVSHSRTRYEYTVPANSTLGAISQLPSVFNEYQHGVADVRYLARRDLHVGVVYWHDRYRVDDFALDSDILNRVDVNSTVLLLMNAYQPYRAHTLMFRIFYLW